MITIKLEEINEEVLKRVRGECVGSINCVCRYHDREGCGIVKYCCGATKELEEYLGNLYTNYNGSLNRWTDEQIEEILRLKGLKDLGILK